MIAGDAESNPGDYPPYYEPKMIRASPVITDGIIARCLKNRVQQRRYRARRRLEADMKKSCLHCQHALLLSEEAQSNGISINWKRDARKAHLFKELMDPSDAPIVPLSVKPSLEAGFHLECHTNPTGKRHWKADARNKSDEDVGTRENDPTK